MATLVVVGGLALAGGGTPPPDAAPATTTCPDQVNTWIGQAEAVMAADGTTGGDYTDTDAICVIVAHESVPVGNPRSINLSDSNAAKGTPSKGLMQTIDSTFTGNCLPGHCGDVYDPVDNIIAGTRYAINRYGSLSNVPGVKSVRAGGPYKPY